MSDVTDPLLAEVLNELEGRELPLLSWGVTSGSYEEGELLDLLEALRPEDDPEQLLERLLQAGMVFERGLAGDRFRTRMAETVRLARHLRQWMFAGPQRDWRTAKTLVSDLRFLSRPRVVPDRNAVDRPTLDTRLAAELGDRWTDRHRAATSAILQGRSVSEFQARATERILDAVGQRGGTCVTAGTGAGKTLAFYLPALTHILSTSGTSGIPRIVAIYPRTELLRDQLAGILSTVRDIEAAGAGRIGVGVLYGATPQDRADATNNSKRRWQSTADGLRCPILNCLDDGCKGELIWPTGDNEGRLLRCAKCGAETSQLTFTRRTLISRAPEVLFTTTEMINRLLGTPRWRRLLVGDSTTSPDYVLLDEVHTYSGTHGAQVANLLRRWRGEMASPSHVVGLSATLADPVGFFSQLIGADAGNVAVVAPAEREMRESGREYFMALRGDPASQTSLLSTTIQTAMLMRRMLDREPGVPSAGAFGTRVFAFTDKLDVVNRLHSQLQDAEGWQADGVSRKPNGSLAVLRASGDDNGARDEVGQLWDAAEELGTLHRSVVVDRTTSQDTGVGSSADTVVATASLEVGFDDPNVGAVLQHKAPRDAAQFLQRRGRAGRDPAMRPWTTVVLSDYGRDRLAFQSYEALFDPQVQPTQLPTRNRVVLKMQATWWLVDHLTRASGGTPLRSVLSTQWSRDPQRQIQAARRALTACSELLTEEGLGRLERGLKWSLRITEEEARSILFDHPRALASAVLPSIVRRLEAIVGQERLSDSFYWADPLVDFVPSSLFAPLQTPEVRVQLPPIGQNERDPKVEPIALSMREFAPGRVSYRYALRGKRDRMWVEPPSSSDPYLDLGAFCEDYLRLAAPPGLDEPVVQPRAIRLSRPVDRTPDSSYGRWTWEPYFRVNGSPVELDVPSGSQWQACVRSFEVMTHRARAPLTVWRLARSVEIERQLDSEPASTRHRVRLDGADAAIGFAMEVDGFRLELALPNSLSGIGPELERALRTTYFEHLVLTNATLVERAPSSFLRDWLAQLALSAVVTKSAGDDNVGLLSVTERELVDGIVDAARSIFGADDQQDDPHVPQHDPGLVTDVEAALHDPLIVAALQACLDTLRDPLPTDALPWAQERFASTISAGVVGAIQSTCPDLDIDDLRPDIELVPDHADGPVALVTISEDQPGGTGVVETAVDRIIEDPRAFWAVVSNILGPCSGERVDQSLRLFLQARTRGELVREVEGVRTSSTLASTTSAWADLRESLFQIGLPSDPTVVSALATRLLRPASETAVEELCGSLLDRWDALEAALGVEVDLRVFAFVASQSIEVRDALRRVASHDAGADGWVVGQIVGLLWSRGSRLRSASLQAYNPYCELPATERLLVEIIANAPLVTVVFGGDEWRLNLDQHLARDGAAQLRCVSQTDAASAVSELMTDPTEVGVLEFHPRVVGVERSSDGFTLTVDIREAHQ